MSQVFFGFLSATRLVKNMQKDNSERTPCFFHSFLAHKVLCFIYGWWLFLKIFILKSQEYLLSVKRLCLCLAGWARLWPSYLHDLCFISHSSYYLQVCPGVGHRLRFDRFLFWWSNSDPTNKLNFCEFQNSYQKQTRPDFAVLRLLNFKMPG